MSNQSNAEVTHSIPNAGAKSLIKKTAPTLKYKNRLMISLRQKINRVVFQDDCKATLSDLSRFTRIDSSFNDSS